MDKGARFGPSSLGWRADEIVTCIRYPDGIFPKSKKAYFGWRSEYLDTDVVRLRSGVFVCLELYCTPMKILLRTKYSII